MRPNSDYYADTEADWVAEELELRAAAMAADLAAHAARAHAARARADAIADEAASAEPAPVAVGPSMREVIAALDEAALAREAERRARVGESFHLTGSAGADFRTDVEKADAFTSAVTIDAWTERLALAARRVVAEVEIAAEGLPLPAPVIVVHPDDEAAMRRAHSAAPTDGPIKLWTLPVIADPRVPARTARLRYDVDVPL